MFKELKQAIKELPEMLKHQEDWNTLYIDYHQPVVQRAWRQWNDNRISIHRISPCGPDEALYHPHPWPMAMVILRGSYEMGIGHGNEVGNDLEWIQPPIACKTIVNGGGCYEMIAENGWHYIRPTSEVYTVMVTGKPWGPWNTKTSGLPMPQKPLRQLDKNEKEGLIHSVRMHLDMFPVRIPGVK